ncbi:MAG: DUF6491 family protein [Pseudomarimonas sp.]
MRAQRNYTYRLFGGIILLVLLVTSFASAAASPRERLASRLVEYEAVAGDPVDGFNFFTLQRFELLGPQTIAVWTRVNKVFLIDVHRPCPGLEFAGGIGVSSSQNRVSARFDAVQFNRERCQIKQIRPIDSRALKARLKAKY